MGASSKPRLWPLWAILIIDACVLLYARFSNPEDTQTSMLIVMGVLLNSLIAGLVWFLRFSRFSKGFRMKGLGVFVAALILFNVIFQIREVSGDFVPLLSYRWSSTYADMDNTAKAAETPVEVTSGAEDYPRFLGPTADSTVKGTFLAKDWQTRIPQEKWRIDVGASWSAFSVMGNLAVTQEQRGDRQMVTCYNLKTGVPVWTYAGDTPFISGAGGDGPRATPTLYDRKVYTLSANGLLNCLDLADGNLIWSHQVQEEHQGQLPDWGYACSPLVYDDLVVVCPGGPEGHSLVAYNRINGELAWSSGDGWSSYSSPQLMEIGGVSQVVVLNWSSLAGHDPETGTLLWSAPWNNGQPTASNPLLLSDNRLLVSAGYGHGCVLFQLTKGPDGFQATEVYANIRLKTKFANSIQKDGLIYGLDDGILVCLDPADGSRKWKKGRYGHGQMLLVEDLLLIQAEKGVLYLIEPTPEGPVELGQVQVLGGKAWNALALSGNLLLVRNHKEAVCLELPER